MKDELKICGYAAALVSASHRPEDVERVFIRRDRMADFGPLLATCAQMRKPYRIVEDDELEKVSSTRHHQGICIVMRPPPLWGHDDVLAAAHDAQRAGKPQAWLFLDRIGNPHNFGAIARTAAHFGALALLIPDWSEAAGYSTASFRTAEGGLEALPVARLADPLHTLRTLRDDAGVDLLATAADGQYDLWQDAPPRAAVWMMGSERDGLAAELRREATATVSIGGTGVVESLNVAAATALVLGASWRAHGNPLA